MSAALWCLVVLGVAALVVLPAGAKPPRGAVVTQLWLPVAGETSTLFDDIIQWSGTVHLTVRAEPQDPIRLYTNVVDLVGVGVFGDIYRATGADTASFPAGTTVLAFTQSYRALVQGIPTDPHSRNDPILPINFELSLTPLGDVGFSTATIGSAE